MVPAELRKLLLFLLRGALHPCDAERLVRDDLVAFQTDRLLRLSILDAVTDDDHGMEMCCRESRTRLKD